MNIVTELEVLVTHNGISMGTVAGTCHHHHVRNRVIHPSTTVT